jgi:hypothetical protein
MQVAAVAAARDAALRDADTMAAELEGNLEQAEAEAAEVRPTPKPKIPLPIRT